LDFTFYLIVAFGSTAKQQTNAEERSQNIKIFLKTYFPKIGEIVSVNCLKPKYATPILGPSNT
jgi:hypothetical protein